MVLGWGSKKAQVHHHDDEDMSMEEILASIRKYVSEEAAPKDQSQFQDVAKVSDSPYRSEEEPRVQRRVVEDQDSELAPSNSFESSQLFSAPQVETVQDFAVTRETLKTKPIMEELSVSTDNTPSSMPNPFAKLTEATKLAQTVRTEPESNSSVTLDQLVGDLARPMVQKWLDQNMTSIVEKMVAQQIAKMTGVK